MAKKTAQAATSISGPSRVVPAVGGSGSGGGNRFLKGNPGGPGGRRPGAGRKPPDVQALLADIASDTHKGVPIALAAFRCLSEMALGNRPVNTGRVAACRELLNRTVGKPRETIDINVQGGFDLHLLITDVAAAAAGADVINQAITHEATHVIARPAAAQRRAGR